ncbi:MAG TPA: hypothetical protein VFV79_05280 [Saprospiraceae bacterium]|nr:hypothetical protein [Saprospiraceae bacterium]
MGLTIHYSGKLRGAECIQPLIEETIDVCQSMNWPYQILPIDPEVPVEGILVNAEGSEPLWLTFQKDGTMCNPILYAYVLKEEGKGIPGEAEQWLFTKTQYAGVETHMALIRFMRYMSEKYFEKFELHDESQFWETNDEEVCRKTFEKYGLIMDMVGAALDSLEHIPDEPAESLAERIEKLLGERFGMKRVE